MASVNKAIILGNLGAEPDLRYTASQASVCTLSIATTERRKDKEGNAHEHTTWHRIVVWNRQAEACSQYLRKGAPVYVEGRISTRTWDDPKTGQKRYTTEIVAERVQFLGKRQEQTQQGYAQASAPAKSHQPAQAPGQSFSPKDVDTSHLDDIPF